MSEPVDFDWDSVDVSMHIAHSKAMRYYQDNLCYSPDQFDSWAGLALGRSRIILDRLNQVTPVLGMEPLKSSLIM